MTSNHHASDPGSPGSMDLAVALFRTAGPVPFDDVDWETFHNRLADRAELSLARLRYPHLATQIAATTRISPIAGGRPWWTHAARWARPTIATSVAAGLALIMVVRASPKESAEAALATVATTFETTDRTRAAFDSAAVGRTGWTMESAVLPSAADLLIPLGKGVVSE